MAPEGAPDRRPVPEATTAPGPAGGSHARHGAGSHARYGAGYGADDGPAEAPLIDLQAVSVVVDGRRVLGPVSWRVEPGQRWVVLGPNGCGKSTLLAVASLARHPTEGSVTVLGHELGRVDTRAIRGRIGLASPGLVDRLRGRLTAGEVVMCGLHGALEPWWHTYDAADRARAGELLARVGLTDFDDRSLATLSSGERQRALLARALMSDPDVVLLDEPTAGLDLAGREQLVEALDGLAADGGPATVLVTHHVEDIPASTTHILALRPDRVERSGPVDEVLTGEVLSTVFGLPVELGHSGGRWSARRSTAPTVSSSLF